MKEMSAIAVLLVARDALPLEQVPRGALVRDEDHMQQEVATENRRKEVFAKEGEGKVDEVRESRKVLPEVLSKWRPPNIHADEDRYSNSIKLKTTD